MPCGQRHGLEEVSDGGGLGQVYAARMPVIGFHVAIGSCGHGTRSGLQEAGPQTRPRLGWIERVIHKVTTEVSSPPVPFTNPQERFCFAFLRDEVDSCRHAVEPRGRFAQTSPKLHSQRLGGAVVSHCPDAGCRVRRFDLGMIHALCLQMAHAHHAGASERSTLSVHGCARSTQTGRPTP